MYCIISQKVEYQHQTSNTEWRSGSTTSNKEWKRFLLIQAKEMNTWACTIYGNLASCPGSQHKHASLAPKLLQRQREPTTVATHFLHKCENFKYTVNPMHCLNWKSSYKRDAYIFMVQLHHLLLPGLPLHAGVILYLSYRSSLISRLVHALQ